MPDQSNRNEAQTRLDLITPALKEAGWEVADGSHIRVEVIAPGRLQGAGRRRDKQSIADYVLVYKNQKLAVVEAKHEDAPVTEGLGQAKEYADKLQTPFAFSTNGHGIYRVDMRNGAEGDVAQFPTPDELWEAVYGASEARERHWREQFSAVPLSDKGGQWQARYYQHNAITKTLDAIGAGQSRILLTLATGTGKTAIAFQIAWKLFQSRWSLGNWRSSQDEQTRARRPRILFLADRNNLADQAFNEFSAFPDDALVRIAPEEIRKRGSVPKNAHVFFTIFQTFMSGSDAHGNPKPSFGDYAPDFFDFIIIDECHRGGANDESSWRAIMEYFAPAVQLGLTATPKRDDNIDTYNYFGEPVYIYSLKQGINDGYLTPFKVKQFATTIDEYVYTSDDDVMEGEVDTRKLYIEEDFNRNIEIKQRENKRVDLFMDDIDQSQKTLVFCANQRHALLIRDLINQVKRSTDPNYCVRVTADDGKRGDANLRAFRDNEKTIPTVLTTSKKLTTGVDARNVRNIVLLRPINTIIEFKQIIGRGTRLFDGKEHFTIYDFVKVCGHFHDPQWDGEPVELEPCAVCDHYPCQCEPPPPQPCAQCGKQPCACIEPPPEPCRVCAQSPCVCQKMVKIKLADGKERDIQHMMATSFWHPDGTPMSAEQFLNSLYRDLPALFQDEDELRRLWSRPDTRRQLLDGLTEKGYGRQQLAELSGLINAEKSDLYDVLAYIAYDLPPISRAQRVGMCEVSIRANYDYQQREFLTFVLNQYVNEGVGELDDERLTNLIKLKYHTIPDAIAELGAVEGIREMFVGFQKHLYESPAARQPGQF